ncbi:hypothetical protein SYNPS1DRAFT_26325 [Syncephalis pseudoplumigaleata]|uniref:Uncharacterized protein n=1 Tax=Syncephalis pseudoplumigaleata TaxID=1712513 RepID=A0A4P9Z6J1_9FUNG|nr:hypothetical protein SYNPS1DRAFT_26325 [Syncephalis pseudoplumigaleata]|eukprot:RKP28068.1 hypothetical protein SYNPS1DRAFT_26325 [Syncephalis pseudoplumigaleata]
MAILRRSPARASGPIAAAVPPAKSATSSLARPSLLIVWKEGDDPSMLLPSPPPPPRAHTATSSFLPSSCAAISARQHHSHRVTGRVASSAAMHARLSLTAMAQLVGSAGVGKQTLTRQLQEALPYNVSGDSPYSMYVTGIIIIIILTRLMARRLWQPQHQSNSMRRAHGMGRGLCRVRR